MIKFRSSALLALLVSVCVASVSFAQQPAGGATPAGAGTTPPMAAESVAETRNKEVVVNWFKLCFEQGKAPEAFPKYVSKKFIEHSRRGRGDYESALKMLTMMGGNGGRGDLQVKAAVNDEMVTIQSKIGVDIFRVVDGKITDHWEGNP